MRRYFILFVLIAVVFPSAGWAARSVNCSKQPDGTLCDDGNICTASDACQAGLCKGSPAAADGTACNDGDHCTLTDTCQSGTCVGSNPVTCPAPDPCYAAGTCNPKNGACSKPKPLADGSPCEDGSACTTNDTCTNKACVGGLPPNCDDGNVCTTDSCNTVTGCVHDANTEPCNDNDACTTSDACANKLCVGSNPVACTALDQCHDVGICNPANGQCSDPPLTGTGCDDGDACTLNDTCQGGVCQGTELVQCLALDQCHDVGICNPANGQCSDPPLTGTSCTDGDACTQTDTCQSGSCVGSNPVVCTAADPCHDVGICDPANGQCSKPPLTGTACDDGDACTQTDMCEAGTCVGSNPLSCLASDQCHYAGSCDPASGACSNPEKKPDGTACDDEDACTTADTCQAGECTGSAVADGTPCDDDDSNTVYDVCAGGVCGGTGLCGNEPCSCPTGTVLCGGVCVNQNTDRNNCGACGTVCGSGTACASGSCQAACPGGTTACGDACVNESTDQNNCGACGNVCASGTSCSGGSCQSACAPGTALCNGTCVNENTDPNNCGTCGTVCAVGTCIGGTCVTDQVAASCLPTSSLAVLTQGTAPGATVTAYVPMGSWSETATGIIVVQLEPTVGAPTVVATAAPVNSCSSNNASGFTVCTGNDNDVYLLHGTTLLTTVTAGGMGAQSFSGGSCTTCGVATDASTGLAWVAEGTAVSSGQLQSLSPAPPPLASVFGPALDLFGQQTSEDISIDPVRHLILSALENGQFQIIDTMTSSVFNAPDFFYDTNGAPLDLNATAEDCGTGIAVAPAEFSSPPVILLADLSQATYTPGSPGTWVAPTNAQIFPDFSHMVAAGPSAIAVAPGSHLAGVTDEFGGGAFGVLQLPAAGGVGTPSAVDYVAANMPDDPAGVPWYMGLDPHPMTAYTSPNSNKAILVVSNVSRTYLALVDMGALLAALRTSGTNTVDPTVDLVGSGIVTFVAE